MTSSGEHGRVAVVGGVGIDLTVEVERLPGPGETVVGDDVARGGGGKGGNAAVAAARAGAGVLFVGAVGQDAEGDLAREQLEAESVDCSGLARVSGRATAVALISVDPTGENQITVAAGANYALDSDWVTGRLHAAADGLAYVLISTEIPLAAVLAAVSAAAQLRVSCILNPAPPLPGLEAALTHHPILTPNRTELAQLTGDTPDDDVETRAHALADRSQAPVLVTLGSDGALLVAPGASETTRLAAGQVEVVDATGAGDTVNGVLAARLAAGDDVTQAARVAVLAGSLSTTGRGARGGMPTAEAIARAGK